MKRFPSSMSDRPAPGLRSLLRRVRSLSALGSLGLLAFAVAAPTASAQVGATSLRYDRVDQTPVGEWLAMHNIPCPAYDGAKQMTVSAWIKPSDEAAYWGGAGPSGTVMAWSQASTPFLEWRVENGRLLLVERTNYGANFPAQAYSTATIDPCVWTHVAVTFDNGILRYYINGQLDTTTSLSITNASADYSSFSSGANYRFGSAQVLYDGLQQEVSVWNKALDPMAVAGLMDGIDPSHPDHANLVGYWKMDDGSGQVVADSSGNGNHATLGMTSASGSDDPTWVPTTTSVCAGEVACLTQDGGFENITPLSAGQYAYLPSYGAWRTVHGTTALLGMPYAGMPPYEGTHAMHVGNSFGPGYVEKDLMTTVGAEYTVSLAVIGWGGGGGLVRVTANGGTDLSGDCPAPGGNTWGEYTFTFTASTTLTTLRVQNISGACTIDDVCVSTEVVPDTTAPVVSISAPLDGSVVSTSAVDVTATVTDDSETTVTSDPAGLAPTMLPDYAGSLALALEGENVITVSAVDAYDNAAATSILVYRDTVAPDVEVSPAEGTVVSSPIPSFGITVNDQTLTDVWIDGVLGGSAEVPMGDTYGVSSVLLAGSIPLWEEGANTIEVVATDAAGNTTTVTRTVILDSTAPVVAITSPENGACYGIGSDLEIPVVATVDDATGTDVTGALTGTLGAGGGTLMGTATLVEGVNTLSVTATNPGLGLAGTETVSVTLDTIAPTVAVTSPEDGACVRGTIEVHTTASDVLPGVVDSTTVFLDGVALAASELYLVDTTLLADGTHVLGVQAVDSCGNVSSTEISIVVDNTAPEVTLSNPFDLDWVMGTIGFDAFATDGGSGLAAVELRAGGNDAGGSMVYGMPVANSGTLSTLVDTLVFMDGDLDLEVTARDCAGNETTVAVTVRVDNTAPDKAITSPADGSTVRCSVDVTAEVNDPNLASVQILVGDEASPVMYAAPYEFSYDTRGRLDGELEITLIATDLAGNVSTCVQHVTVDNLEFELKPERLQLKSRGKAKSVTVKVEGQTAGLLVGLDPSQLTLCVEGGSSIPANTIFGHEAGWDCTDEHEPGHRGHRAGHEHGAHGDESEVKLKFDRRLLIGALRAAGHTSGSVEVTLKATVDGEVFVIGSDEIRVKK